MELEVEKYDPVQVIKYPYQTDYWAYLFKGDNVYLFDCMANLVCESKGKSTEKCMEHLKQGERGKIIWQDEEILD